MSMDKMEGTHQPSSDSVFPANTLNDQPSSVYSSAYPQRTPDSEKTMQMQQQLVLLLHAHKCQQREKEEQNNGLMNEPCYLPGCSNYKEVLLHMKSCGIGRNCQYNHCASSLQIMAHWKNCEREDCPVCKPLRHPSASSIVNEIITYLEQNGVLPIGVQGPPDAERIQIQQQFLHPSGVQSDHLGLASSVEETVDNSHVLDLPNPEGPNTNKEWQLSMTKDLRNHCVGEIVKALIPSPDPKAILDPRIKDSVTYATNVEKELFEMANDREEYFHLLDDKIYNIEKELQKENNHLRPEQLPIVDLDELNVNTPQIIPLLPAAMVSDETKPQQKQQTNETVTEKTEVSGFVVGVQTDHLGLASSTEESSGDSLILNTPNPVGPTTNKEWQLSMTKDLRNDMAETIVRAMYPSPDPNALLDPRIKDLVAYGRRKEKEMFEMANDREEYFQLLAEKISNIRKELQETKNNRLRPEQLWIADLDELNMLYPPNVSLLPAGWLPKEIQPPHGRQTNGTLNQKTGVSGIPQPTVQEMLHHQKLMQQMYMYEQRLQNSNTVEERLKLFNDIKRMPHLFSAFLKLSRNEEQGQKQFPELTVFSQDFLRDPHSWQRLSHIQEQRSSAIGGSPNDKIQEKKDAGKTTQVNPNIVEDSRHENVSLLPAAKMPDESKQQQEKQTSGTVTEETGVLGIHQRSHQEMRKHQHLMQQMNQLEQRIRNTRTPEERTQLFNELKRTPHLFSAFLKMSRHQEGQQQFPATAMFAQNFIRDPSAYMGGQAPPIAPGGAPWQQQFQQRPQHLFSAFLKKSRDQEQQQQQQLNETAMFTENVTRDQNAYIGVPAHPMGSGVVHWQNQAQIQQRSQSVSQEMIRPHSDQMQEKKDTVSITQVKPYVIENSRPEIQFSQLSTNKSEEEKVQNGNTESDIAENKEEQKKQDQQPLKQSNQPKGNVQNNVHQGSPTLPNLPNVLPFGIPLGVSYLHQYPIMTPMMTPTNHGHQGVSQLIPVTHVHSSTVPGVPGGQMYPGIPVVNVTVQYYPQDHLGKPSGQPENRLPHHLQPETLNQPIPVNHGTSSTSSSSTAFPGTSHINPMMQNRTSEMGHPSNRTTTATANDPQHQPEESKEVSLLSKMSLKDRARIFKEVMETPISEFLKMERMIYKDDENETHEDKDEDDEEISENTNSASSGSDERLNYQPKQNQTNPGMHSVNGMHFPSFLSAQPGAHIQQPTGYPYPGAHLSNQMNSAYPGDPRRNPVNPHVPRNGMQGGFQGIHSQPQLANPYGISYQTRAYPAMPTCPRNGMQGGFQGIHPQPHSANPCVVPNAVRPYPAMPTAPMGHPQQPWAYPPLNNGQYPNAMTMPHVNPGPGVHPAYNGIRNGFAQPNQAPSVYDNTAGLMAQMSAVQHHMQLMQLQQIAQHINSGGHAMQQGPVHTVGVSANHISVDGKTVQNGSASPQSGPSQ